MNINFWFLLALSLVTNAICFVGAWKHGEIVGQSNAAKESEAGDEE